MYVTRESFFNTHTHTYTHAYSTDQYVFPFGEKKGKLESAQKGQGMGREIKWFNIVETQTLCPEYNVPILNMVWQLWVCINSYEVDFLFKGCLSCRAGLLLP